LRPFAWGTLHSPAFQFIEQIAMLCSKKNAGDMESRAKETNGSAAFPGCFRPSDSQNMMNI